MGVNIAVFWPGDDFIKSNFGAKRWLSFYIYVMQAFEADTLCLIGAPDISMGYDIVLKQYVTVEEMLAEFPNHKIVSFVGTANKTLQEYEHPKDALYLFGNDYGDVPNVSEDKLRIDNSKNIKTLWSHNCVSIVLYDRSIKDHGSY